MRVVKAGQSIGDRNQLFVPSVGVVGAVDGNGLAVVLVGPAGVVPNALNDHVQVHVEGGAERLAIVGCFQILKLTLSINFSGNGKLK